MRRRESTIVEALDGAHRDLLGDLRKLEVAVGRSSKESVTLLTVRLSETRADLVAHFRFEEQGGYMEGVREQAPHLKHAVRQLLEEHSQLLQSLDALIAEARTAEKPATLLREKVRGWTERIRQHEAHENALVQEAVNLDIGAED